MMNESSFLINGIVQRCTVPVSLLFVCVLSYGLLAPWLGYYWDDWIMLWTSHSHGQAGLLEAQSSDRPFLGWLYSFTSPLLGESPFPWHIFALVTRWLGAVGLWWCLRGVWPRMSREAAGVAFLFAVYPGFTQQPIAWMYSHHFIVLLLVIISLGAMVWALRTPRFYWPLTALALVCMVVSMAVIEYHVGLELLRPVLIWLVLSDLTHGERVTGIRERLRRVLVSWSPYLIALAMFLTWRVFIFRSARTETDHSAILSNLLANPLREVGVRLYSAFTDIVEAGLLAWGQSLPRDFFTSDRIVWTVLGLAISLVVAVATFYCMRLEARAKAEAGDNELVRLRWAWQAMIVGLFAIIVGQLVPWFAGRHILLGTIDDRFGLPSILGSSLLLAGAVHALIRTRAQRAVVICAIVGLSAGFHFHNANAYRRDWAAQKSLFWQLSWRAPGLKPGTSLLIDSMPASVTSPRSYTVASALNFIYDPENKSRDLNYWFSILSKDLGDEVPSLAGNVRVADVLRTMAFKGSTSDSVAVWFSPPGCLRVLDPERDETPELPATARAARAISNVDRIVAKPSSPARPPREIFGPEPERCWCYYFQKADLARQTGDWSEVARMGDEARRLGLKPGDATEWLPFIEGYTHAGRYEEAREVCKLALKSMPPLGPGLNDLLKRLEDAASTDAARLAFIEDLKSELTPSAQ